MSTTTTTITAEQLTTFVRAAELRAEGASYVAIGRELGVSDKTAARYVAQGQPLLEERAAKTARKPRKAKGATTATATQAKARKAYETTVAERVIEMRDEEQASWIAIAEELELGSPGTARRVYRNAKDAAGESIPIGAPLGTVGRGGRTPWVNAYPWAN